MPRDRGREGSADAPPVVVTALHSGAGIGRLHLGSIPHIRPMPLTSPDPTKSGLNVEGAMLKIKTVQLAVALSVCAAFAIPATVSAQTKKKISYEEAFKRCKAFMDKEKGSLGAGTTADANKSTRGAACMRKFGHRL